MSAKPAIAIGVVVLTAAVGCGAYYWSTHRGPKPMRLPGTVEIQDVRLSSKVGGRIKSVSVKDGDVLRPGQVLVEFEMPEIEAQREQAVRKREAAAASLDKLLNGARPEDIAIAEAGVKVAETKVAQVKAGWRDEEIEQVRKDLAATVAEVELAKVEWERQRTLPKTVTTESQVDAARTAYLRWTAQAAAARAKLAMYELGPRKEDVAAAEAELQKAKANLALVKAPARSEDAAEASAKVAELEARIHELDAQLAEAVVKAPEACVVEVLTVRPGDVVAPNQPIARVLRAGDLWVKAYIPATELGKLKLNQTVEVTIDSHPGKRFTGTVAQIATVSEFTPRNVQSVEERANQVFAVKVRVTDTEGIVKSGMAADVFVPVE